MYEVAPWVVSDTASSHLDSGFADICQLYTFNMKIHRFTLRMETLFGDATAVGPKIFIRATRAITRN
ncbi:hypothetical protein AU489_02390 [Lonsdalea populi]|uniref:Uncharacterized protein n=2 Tax=Lonsdalea TaxID=1082702 RepID=A0ACD1JA94_9GAMM|nr:hypothetical protein AU485_15580 [Lonsdalea quercina]RAT20372.1 hypothetical protein AU488_14365 [Lonsdalea populi]RAT23789.1 hypothetical protein AU487_00065 [Lonsdalea populi]RAT27926.1 hypothetical protein AU489_02390 [Lonsdalea populi]RAT38207.1 hypothetical protein AU492_00010 [Lonsdalea populi]